MKLRNKLEYIGEYKPNGRVGTLIGYDKQHDAIKVEFEGEDGGIITSLEVSNIREVEHLVDGRLYTLDELCGEEE